MKRRQGHCSHDLGCHRTQDEMVDDEPWLIGEVVKAEVGGSQDCPLLCSPSEPKVRMHREVQQQAAMVWEIEEWVKPVAPSLERLGGQQKERVGWWG